jgi:IclR family acetate operon transcriptional repressor
VRRELRTIRRRGFAVNDQETETGLTAVGVAVPPAGGFSGAALSLAAPSARYSRDRLPVWGSALADAAGAIARDLKGA